MHKAASSYPAHIPCNKLRARNSKSSKLRPPPFTSIIGSRQHPRKTPRLRAGRVFMNHHTRKTRRHIYGPNTPTRPKNERPTHLTMAGRRCPPKRPKLRPILLNPPRLGGGREHTRGNEVMRLHAVRWRHLAPPATAPIVVIGSTAHQKRKVGHKVSGKPPFNLKRNLAIRLDRKRGAQVVERQNESLTAPRFHSAPSCELSLEKCSIYVHYSYAAPVVQGHAIVTTCRGRSSRRSR